MQHVEADEEAFVTPDTQGDEDSPFVAPHEWGAYHYKPKKKPKHIKPRNEEPKLVCHTEPGDVVQVEGALFIVVRKAGLDRWVRTWLTPPVDDPGSSTDQCAGACYKTGPYNLPGHFALDQIIMLRPKAWR